MAVFDVPAIRLINEIALDLEKQFSVSKPAFSDFVKTGSNRERPPQQENWYYVRMASIFYRIFKEGPLGTESLRTYYGGKKNRGVRPSKFRKASGKIIRLSLQQLEGIGFLRKAVKGRVISGKGHSYLEKKAKSLIAVLQEEEKSFDEKKQQRQVIEREQEQKKVKKMGDIQAEPSKFKKETKDSLSKKDKRKQRKKDKKEKKK